MSQQLNALLYRYYTAYRRFPGRFVNEFFFALIIAGSLAVRDLPVLGILASIIYFVTVPFTFLVVLRIMLGEIVAEKAAGIKEYLKLNGLPHLIYQLYVFILTSAKMIFFTCFVIAGLVIGSIIESYNDGYKIVIADTGETIQLYLLCAFASIPFILFLSTLFSDAKVASSVGGLFYGAMSLASLIILATDNIVWYYLICLFPQSVLTLGLIHGQHDWVNGMKYSSMKLMMVFDFFFYLVLYSYLDQVLKDENGVRKSPFFFLNCLKSKKSKNKQYELMDNHLLEPQLVQEDTSSAIYHEPMQEDQLPKRTAEVCGLTKRFKNFKAVNDVSFSIYEGQVFSLLGHNGAGKTTMIRMMTGLLEADGGKVLYDGQDFWDNLEDARKRIGICNQQDILFEKLTVSEHFELIANLRKIPTQDIPTAVEEALRKVNLVNERDKYSEELSGGNKRKLSLGMAVLGNTKVIFLDEPTSGMDPQNRRAIWQHLKQLKEQGLTILLTTHHLDEADELSDRIAIMSHGKLLAMGTSEFFKKNFGVGYHLSLTPQYEKMTSEVFQRRKPDLKNIISEIIPSAKFDEQTAADVLKCSLPFAAMKDFPKLFVELEEHEDVRISVEMNTLEDVFVNIGLSEEKLLKGNHDHIETEIRVQPPACLAERPHYNFIAQTYALLKRRVYLLTRSGRNLALVLVPLALILIGVLGSFGFDMAEVRMGYFETIVFLSFSLNTAVYCSLPVYEREEKLKYIMDVMGLRNLPYWIGNVLVDFALMTIMNVIVFGFYQWFYNGMNPFVFLVVKILTPSQFLLLLIPHGLALITLGYAYSFMFDKALSAVKVFPILYFFALFPLHSIAFSKVAVMEGSVLQNPILASVVGIICPSGQLLFALAGTIGNNRSGLSLTQCVINQFIYAGVFFLMTIWLESRRLSAKTKENTVGWSASEPHEIPIDLNEINSEKARITQAGNDPIRAMDLMKVYDNGYTAVKGISFGVEPGQIFGLLGPNGAGKSTTFNVLTAATPKSSGSAQLLGQEIHNNMPEVYENVGVCPQFNALWDFLTVKEHLVLFGNLKGLRGDKLDQVINYYLDVLQLRAYANKKAHELSGGNKRKLCVANAFIGSAYLIFLDEPSTGVDPLARRYLWNSIQQVLAMRQASIVLTTHSMYEAESLSHKIGILINGRFVCLGPTQYLKNKYSQGYKITVSLIPHAADPMNLILENFPEANRLQEASSIQQTYHVPFEGFKFSQAFEKLEELKERRKIKDFSIYNTTLEQVFIYFSKFQIDVEPRQ